jgi:hypothetical protein
VIASSALLRTLAEKAGVNLNAGMASAEYGQTMDQVVRNGVVAGQKGGKG